MAEKSGFFNAIRVEGEYDRKYNANDYCDNLAVIIGNGVLRSSDDDLKVTVSGMAVSVYAGRAWIKGHYYVNDSALSFTVPTAPIAGQRYDRIMLRLNTDISSRSVSVVYVQGTASNAPVKPSPTRTETVYDLVLADIFVDTNAVSAVATDTRSNAELCGWVYSTSGDGSFFTSLDNSFWEWFTETKDTLSSVTLFKRYQWRKVLTAATSTLQFNIPQYDVDTCFIEVYVNGILDSRYTLEGNVITFAGTLIAGTVVVVNCFKSIDGTGIESVADEITELQNAVAQLDGVSRFTYKCTGLNDNISISQIAAAIRAGQYDSTAVTDAAEAFLEALGGNAYLEALPSDAQVTIDISGSFNASTPFAGLGTSASPYKWISFGEQAQGESKRIIFDFAKCHNITIICTGATTNYIFYGGTLDIRNAKVNALYYNDNNTNIQMIECNGNKMDAVFAENCNFFIRTTGSARIADHGIYTNCICEITSDYAQAYCFKPKSTTFIRLIGGSYRAFARTDSGITPAIFHTSASETDAVAMAYNIHCPSGVVEGYTQGFLSVANAGNTYINGVVSRLTSSGSYNEIIGQINKNKA